MVKDKEPEKTIKAEVHIQMAKTGGGMVITLNEEGTDEELIVLFAHMINTHKELFDFANSQRIQELIKQGEVVQMN